MSDLEEYKILRERASRIISQLDQLEYYTIAAVAALYAFSANFSQNLHDHDLGEMTFFLCLFLPIPISVFSYWRMVGFSEYLVCMNDYTLKLEKKLFGEHGGWLHYYYGGGDAFSKLNSPHNRLKFYRSRISFAICVGTVLIFSAFLCWYLVFEK